MNRWPQVCLCVCLCVCLVWAAPGCDSEPVAGTDPGDQLPLAQGGNEVDAADLVVGDSEKAGDPGFSRESALTAADDSMRAGQTQRAISELQRVLLADPNDAEVLFRLANVQASLGDVAPAFIFLLPLFDDAIAGSTVCVPSEISAL